MTSVSYSYTRQNLKKIFDEVCHDHEPVKVKRKNGENVIIISSDDYSSLRETLYLMSSPSNHKRILDARSETNLISLEDAKKQLDL